MIFNELSQQVLAAAAPSLGDGPVTMVNLVWFRDRAIYPDGFEGAPTEAREAYYEGYAGAFAAVAAEVGVTGVEVLLKGSRTVGLIVGPDDDWDDIVIVRYPSFAAVRAIVESEQYRRLADPHRRAAVENCRFIALAS